MPNAISAVGTIQAPAYSLSASPITRTVTPTAVGNLIVVYTVSLGNVAVGSMSGGNCTDWTLAAGRAYILNTSAAVEMWIGTATATGSATLTITSATGGTSMYASYQEFAGGGANTVWSVEGAQFGITSNTAAVTSMVFKALTPGGGSRLYTGYGFATTAVNTAPSGYTMQKPAATQAAIYNVNVSTTQTPSAAMTSGRYETCAALITAETVVTARTTDFMPFFA